MKTQKPLLLNEIWPQERDYCVRPERLKYVRRMKSPSTCVFCEAAAQYKKPQRLVVYKGQTVMVLLNKYPYNNGHVLVLPIRHVADLTELTPEEHEELWVLVRETSRILRKSYTCKGLNVGVNLGAAAGAGIPDHLHVHLIPRWFGDTNFFPLIAETKLIVESLETTYKKLTKEFSKLKKAESSTGHPKVRKTQKRQPAKTPRGK